MTRDRDFKDLVRQEARRTGEPYARVQQRLAHEPPLANMWSAWAREFASIDEPMKLLQLSSRYLSKLDFILDRAAMTAADLGVPSQTIRTATRDTTLAAQALTRAVMLRAGAAPEAPPAPSAAIRRWRKAVMAQPPDPLELCEVGGELRDYLRVLRAHALMWCRRSGATEQAIHDAAQGVGQRPNHRFIWKPQLTDLKALPASALVPSGERLSTVTEINAAADQRRGHRHGRGHAGPPDR